MYFDHSEKSTFYVLNICLLVYGVPNKGSVNNTTIPYVFN